MDNYKTIEQKLKAYEPFRGNSLWATRSGDEYTVYSYSTQIARASVNVLWHEVEPRKYSVTTSRHQNLIRRAWGLN
jgi:hypothetical protein